MENQELIKQTEIETQKRLAWGNFGVGMFKTEIDLQNKASIAKEKLSVLPITIFDVPGAEERLAEGKKSQKAIETSRKEITSRFDDVTKRLMENEKSLTDPITNLSNEIIKIKKADEEKQRKQKAMVDELVRCKEFYQNEAIRIDSELKNKVLDFVSRCYNRALEDSINPTALKDYLATSKQAVTDKQFISTIPTFHNVYITVDQVAEISNANFKLNFLTYVEMFAKQLDEKFSDYDVAFDNKAEALVLAQKEDEEKKKQIAQIAQQQQVSNKIEATAFTSTPATFYTKALKKSYEIDMPETCENALALVACFSANIHLCMKYIKITKWFNFSAEQAGKALSKVKCEDNEFMPIGIIFKEVEKL